MRLSNLAIALATVATVPAAYAAELATTTDFQKISEELAVEEQKITDEIKTLEAELDTQATTDGTTTRTVDGGSTEPTETTTEEKTLTTTITEPCPMQATVMCDEKHDTVTKEVNGCTYTECVPKEMCATIAVACMESQVAVPYIDDQGCEYYVCEDATPREECSLTFIDDPCPDCEGWVANEDCTGAICVSCRETLPPEYQCEDPAPCDPNTQTTLTSTDESGCVVHTCYEVCNTLTAEPTECTGSNEVRQIDLGTCEVTCLVMCPQPVCQEGTTFISQDPVTCETTCTDAEVVATRRGHGGGGGKKAGGDSTTEDGSTTTTKGGGKKGGNKKNLRW